MKKKVPRWPRASSSSATARVEGAWGPSSQVSATRPAAPAGSRGIGLAVAQSLARAGHEVTVTGSRDDAAAQNAAAHGLHTARFDVADTAQVDAFFARETDRGFDIVVHCAGFTRDKLMMMM